MFNFLKKSDGRETNNSNSKAINSDEYERCLKRIAELDTEIGVLETKTDAITSSLANLRGIINRKLGGAKIIDEDGNEKEEKKTATVIKDEYVAFG